MQTYKVFASGLLPARGLSFVASLLCKSPECFFYTKVVSESQNFSTHSEHSGPVCVEWVAKPKLPAPVCILLSYSS